MRRRENERFARRDSLVRQPLEIAQERRAAPSGVVGKGERANEYHLIEQIGGLPLVELEPRREIAGHLITRCLAAPQDSHGFDEAIRRKLEAGSRKALGAFLGPFAAQQEIECLFLPRNPCSDESRSFAGFERSNRVAKRQE